MSTGAVPPQTTRRPANRRDPPGWRVWALALGGAAVFIVALVVFVNHEEQTTGQPANVTNPAAVREENREARAVEATAQAPHVVPLHRHEAPRAALTAAVAGYMKRQIATEPVEGPFMRARCTPAPAAAGGSPSRLAYRCTVVAANVNYPFLGVVDAHSGQVTYCERILSALPSQNVPLSGRCT